MLHRTLVIAALLALAPSAHAVPISVPTVAVPEPGILALFGLGLLLLVPILRRRR